MMPDDANAASALQYQKLMISQAPKKLLSHWKWEKKKVAFETGSLDQVGMPNPAPMVNVTCSELLHWCSITTLFIFGE